MKIINQDAVTKPASKKSDFTGEAEIFDVAENEFEQLRGELASEKMRVSGSRRNTKITAAAKREIALAGDEGKRELLERLISLADDLDLALSNADESPDAVAEGLRMIHRRFRDLLEANGIVGFESKGEIFDPERHEAFDVVSGTENEPETVHMEIRRGYFWNDKLLRPALVVVAH